NCSHPAFRYRHPTLICADQLATRTARCQTDVKSVMCSLAEPTLAARKKVATFFDRGLDRRPVKVVVVPSPASYPPAKDVGVPQFKLFFAIEWVFVLDVSSGSVLTRAVAACAPW